MAVWCETARVTALNAPAGKRFAALVLALVLPVTVMAGDCPTVKPHLVKKGTFSILFENDLFANTDQDYTNGIQLSWVSPDLSHYRDDPRLPDWSRWFIERLPFIHECGLQRNVGLELGQKIFTPRDISRRELIRDDRPYGGWLYAGIAFHNKNVNRLDTLAIQVGMVGPASLAEQAQNYVHEIRGIATAKGWDHQLNNEPGLLFIYERKNRLNRPISGRIGMDVITQYGATLGNVFTFIDTGAELRLGWNIPADFGTALIRPGGQDNAPVDSNDKRLARPQAFGIHVFAAVMGRGTLRDIFLDGNSFSESHRVDKNYWVADIAVGLGLTWQGVKLTYTQVFRSREFRGQDALHKFGSISLSYSF